MSDANPRALFWLGVFALIVVVDVVSITSLSKNASKTFSTVAAQHHEPPPVVNAAPLQVGFGDTDITPKVEAMGKPVYLAGFGHNRKAIAIRDPLQARVVVLKHAD